MQEKIITEKASLQVGDYQEPGPSHLISFTEIEKHLSDGWSVKQMFITPYAFNSKSASDLVITVHLQKE